MRLVARPVLRVEQERGVVLDDAQRQAQAVEDGPHPLRVALGQVVVDRDHVDAPTGHRVERGRDGTHERLALAGALLRDASLVEHHGAHQLDVEGPHAQLPAGDLTGGREHVRQDVVEGGLEALEVVLLARPAHVRAALPLGMVQLVVGWRRGGGVLRHLGPDLGHLLADLLVRECLVVLLEAVDPGHDGAQLG